MLWPVFNEPVELAAGPVQLKLETLFPLPVNWREELLAGG
jgi:hypothetical protein